MPGSKTDTQTPRFKGLKLGMVLLALLVLVCLPVLPPAVLNEAVGLLRDLPLLGSIIEPAGPTPDANTFKPGGASLPIDQITIMQRASQLLEARKDTRASDPAAENQLGTVLMQLGEFDAALKHFNLAVDRASVQAAALKLRSDRFARQGQADQSAACFIEYSRLNNELSAARANILLAYERSGQDSRAEAQMAALRSSGLPAPQSTSRRTSLVVAHLVNQGTALMRARRFAAARNIFESAAALDPDLALAHHQLGLCAAFMGNCELSKKEFERTVALEPNNAIAHNNLGLAYRKLDEKDRAVRELGKSVALAPDLLDAALNLGDLLAASSNYAQAESVYHVAFAHHPNSAELLNNLGVVQSLQGKYEEAIQNFEGALANNPDLPAAHYGLGITLIKTRHYHRAGEEFRQASLLSPNFLDATVKMQECFREIAASTPG